MKRLTLLFLCLFSVASANVSEFAFALYPKIEEENTIFSPYSIYTNLAMVWMGAKGGTRSELKSALHLTKTSDFLPMQEALEKAQGYRFSIANGLFTNKGTSFTRKYQKNVEENFIAKLISLDFDEEDTVLETVNSWVSDKTEGKITEIITEKGINSSTRMVAVNALYFEGEWNNAFNPKKTTKAPFYSGENKSKDVPMMHQMHRFKFIENDDFKALWLPMHREGSKEPLLECLFVLQKNDKETFSFKTYEKMRKMGKLEVVSVSIPKFCFRQKIDLVGALKAMGVKDAFSMQADFSGIDGMRNLYLNEVLHESYFALDERGVTASSATSSTLGLKSLPAFEEAKEFTANRPFTFFLIDHQTGSILFMGHINMPVWECDE